MLTHLLNPLQVSSSGLDYMDYPHELCLPTLPDHQVACISNGDKPEASTNKSTSTRESKGAQALPVIRSLLSDHQNWFDIDTPEDYQYPGLFRHSHPQRVAHCKDVTTLPFYNKSNQHFLFEDIQLGKGTSRGVRQITVSIDGKPEEVCYKIAPCKGVKQCGQTVCKYITSTRESKPCPHHPDIKLQPTGYCPIDFFYVWPENPKDTRRWIGGLVHTGDMLSQDLHNHPINPPSKIPVKVEADIKGALLTNPHLKTSEIMIGRTCCICKVYQTSCNYHSNDSIQERG